MRTALIAAAIVAAACRQLPAQELALPRVEQIDGDRVHTLLRPDAIPAIDEPRFVRAPEATFMRDDEPVLGVVAEGVVKAYSIWHLDHHEIVNDTLAGQPVAVTW